VTALRIVDRAGIGRTAVGSELPTLATPTYFPAISSTCSTAPPEDLIRLLVDARFPRALVSAYDCKRRLRGGLAAATKLLSDLRQAGCTVMLDSGLFECQVLGETSWSSEDYDTVSASVPYDILLSFDSPAGSTDDQAGTAGHRGEASGPRSSARLVHIVHGSDRASIIEKTRQVLASGVGLGIAIPDRECGPDLLSRIRTVAAVRRVMNETDETLLLHLLGCGNPVVMAAYTLAGADTFDSLDWAQGAIDVRSLTLTDPVLLGRTGCRCKVCTDLPGPDGQLALLHNLLFYQEFGGQLRTMVREQTVLDFLQAFTGKNYAEGLAVAAAQTSKG
jgi:queuine/archaeosine tRNA-ribosyltransferase